MIQRMILIPGHGPTEMAKKESNLALYGAFGLGAFLLYEFFFKSPTANATTPVSSVVQTGAILNYSATVNPSALGVAGSGNLLQYIPFFGSSVSTTITQQVSAILSALGIVVTQTGGSGGNITMTVEVNNTGYAHATDLQAVIDNAVFQASGYLPVTSSIAFTSQSTETPAAPSSSFSLSSFFGGLGTGAISGLLLVVVGIVAVVVMFPEVVGVAAARKAAA